MKKVLTVSNSVLTVGAPDIRLGWFLAALVPGMFSGIAACFVAIPIIISSFNPAAFIPWPIVGIDLFGFASGITAFILARKRIWFLRKSHADQQHIALGIWAVHVFVFFTVVGFGIFGL